MSDGLWTKYRAQYAKLPPGLQMIGLQLWMPFFFVIFFCLCYVFAFHAPQPHGIPTAVIGTGPQTSQFAQQLQQSSGGTLDVAVEPSAAAAQQDVRTGDLAAAYAPGTGTATLYVASGAQFQLAAVAKATFGATAAAQHATLHIEDLAPLPSNDSYGTSLFYLTLVWIICGYMVGMFVGMMGASLAHRFRFAIIIGADLLLTLISVVLVRYVVGAVRADFFALWGIGVFTAVSVGLVVNGLGYFFGRFVTGAALLLFVFANIPSSGGAFPPEFMPEPFRALHSVVAGTGTIDVLRSLVYNVGPGAGRGALIIAVYAVVGLTLSFVGKLYFDWRTARRKARDAAPSMMFAAQQAAMAAAASASATDTGEEEKAAEATSDEAEADAVAAVSGAP